MNQQERVQKIEEDNESYLQEMVSVLHLLVDENERFEEIHLSYGREPQDEYDEVVIDFHTGEEEINEMMNESVDFDDFVQAIEDDIRHTLMVVGDVCEFSCSHPVLSRKKKFK